MTDLFGSLLKHMEELLRYLTDYFQTMQDKSLMKREMRIHRPSLFCHLYTDTSLLAHWLTAGFKKSLKTLILNR